MWRSCIVSETDELIAAVKADVKDEKVRAKICMQLRHADSADADIIVLKNRIANCLSARLTLTASTRSMKQDLLMSKRIHLTLIRQRQTLESSLTLSIGCFCMRLRAFA